jgi:RNA polymerase sigma-70 factor, ECF subfamily
MSMMQDIVPEPAPPRVSPPVDVEQLFREHGPFVWRTLRRFGLSQADADDLCQEVFLVVFRRYDAFEHRSSLETWLYGISMRVALAHRRRASSQREKPWASPPETAGAARQDQEVAAHEARILLERALDVLDEDKRAVFVLHEIEQRSMNEVAEALHCPLQTAYSRLHAARDQVKSFVRKAARGSWREETPDGVRMGVLALAFRSKIAPPVRAAARVSAIGAKAVGVLACVAIAGALWYATRTPTAASAPTSTPAVTVAAMAPTATAEPKASPIPTVSVDDLPRAAPSAQPKAKAPRESDTALLRRAQDALASNPARALALVGEHQKSYPRSAFAQEREVLAIDALIRLGRRSEAEARADAFARAYPSSGHNRRIDSLLGR